MVTTFLVTCGSIVHPYREYQLYGRLNYRDGKIIEGPSHSKGSKRINYTFVSCNLLHSTTVCGTIEFHKFMCSDHKGFFIDFVRDCMIKRKRPTTILSFKRYL